MRTSTIVAVLVLTLIAAPAVLMAGDITYNVDQTVGTGLVTGSITTDGSLGTLNDANIVTWTLNLNDGVDPIFTLQGGVNSQELIEGTDLSATPTQLLYNFSGNGLFLLEATTIGDSGPFVCYSSVTTCSPPNTIGIAFSAVWGESPAFGTAMSGTQVIATAGTPEPSSLALLGSGLLGAIAAFRRKRLN